MRKKITIILIAICYLGLVAKAQTPYMLKNFCPSNCSGGPSGLLYIDSTLFFSSQVSNYTTQLCKSDGTSGGTVMIRNIGSYNPQPYSLTNVNGKLFFSADTLNLGRELWKSDGTASGTIMIKDINSGAGHAFPNGNTSFINLNGILIFVADDGVNGVELWKSDGTTAGTVLIKDINPGSPSSKIQNFINVNGTLFFTADNGTNGQELWKSNGTTAGTVMVKDINPTGDGVIHDNYSFQYHYFMNVNNVLFFRANDGTTGGELWKSDGTDAGTVLVKEICAGNSASSSVQYFVTYNNNLFFSAYDGSETGMWKSDGTSGGTIKISSISISTIPIISNGMLFFQSSGELWKSDGTGAGTLLVKDIITSGSSEPDKLTNVNDTLYFVALKQNTGRVLYKSDGTSAGTMTVEVNPQTINPDFLTNLNGVLFFSGYNDTYGAELWALNTVPTTVAPIAPTFLSAYAVSSSQIDLSWTDNSMNENKFIIERSPNGTNGWLIIDSVLTNYVSYSNIDLTPNTSFYYRILAKNNIGSSAYSDIANATTYSVTPPADPTNLILTGIKTTPLGKIKLDWTDNSNDESNFVVQRSTDSTYWSTQEILSQNSVSYIDSNLFQGTYFYKIIAYNQIGASGYSNVVKIKIFYPPAPTAPSNLSINVIKNTVEGKIEISWTDNSTNENGFIISRMKDSIWSSLVYDTVLANVTTYVDSVLPGGTYFYYVDSYNNDGRSYSWSYVKGTIIDTVAPATPTNLTLTPLRLVAGAVLKSIRLNWDDNSSNEDGFKVERSSDGNSGWFQTGNVTSNITTFTDTGLAPSTVYYYRVLAYNATGNSSYSDTVSVSTLTAINTLKEDIVSSTVYPNPFKHSSTLVISTEQKIFRNTELALFNMEGVKVKHLPIFSNETVIEREQLPVGMYFYTITNKKGMLSSGKIVLQ